MRFRRTGIRKQDKFIWSEQRDRIYIVYYFCIQYVIFVTFICNEVIVYYFCILYVMGWPQLQPQHTTSFPLLSLALTHILSLIIIYNNKRLVVLCYQSFFYLCTNTCGRWLNRSHRRLAAIIISMSLYSFSFSTVTASGSELEGVVRFSVRRTR